MKRIVLHGVCLAAASAFGQVTPSARMFLASWQSAGFTGAIPSPRTIVSVRDYGAMGDGMTDDRAAVLSAIAALGGAPGVVYFPAGTYYMQSNISVPPETILRGRRSEDTTLRFETTGHCINVAQGQSGVFQPVVSGYGIHSSSLVVTDGTVFEAGGFAEIREENDPDWGASTWAEKVAGQILRISSVVGNTLTLETPLRLDYRTDLNPEIRPITMVTGVGVENLKIERLLAGTAEQRDNLFTIRFNYATDCWVRGVELYNGFGGHIGIEYGTRIDVTGCYIHHAHEYEGGGSGYGVRLEFKTGECLVENNIFQHLRHSMLVQAGVNGNVFGYNYSRENYWDNGIVPADVTSDITCHGNYVYANLFEGNICQHIWIDDSHGQNGPLNTFFRNRAELRGINVSASQSSGQNYVGNEAFRNDYLLGIWPGDGYSPRGTNNFEHGNNTESDGLQAPGTGTLPDYSYYLNDDPETAPPLPGFWNIADDLPTIGPPHTLETAKNIPANVRYGSGGSKTVGPPSIAAQPRHRVVNRGQTAVFEVEAYGTPAAAYQWRAAGVTLTGETNATLILENVKLSDQADFDVVVSDDGGAVTSAPAALIVSLPPGDFSASTLLLLY